MSHRRVRMVHRSMLTLQLTVHPLPTPSYPIAPLRIVNCDGIAERTLKYVNGLCPLYVDRGNYVPKLLPEKAR
jgi:hypothetical protein